MISEINVQYLIPKDINKLARMCFADGVMRKDFEDLVSQKYEATGNKEYPHNGRVFIKYVDEKIVAWGLAFEQICRITRNYETMMHIWVCTRHRRKGYGSELFRKMVMDPTNLGRVQVIPHDFVSKEFFRSHGIDYKGVVKCSDSSKSISQAVD